MTEIPPDAMPIIEAMKAKADGIARAEVTKLVATIDPNQDSVLSVLRFHLLSESLLERAIAVSMPRGDLLTGEPHLGFAAKLRIVGALAILDQATLDSLKQLNRLRNECAHQAGRAILAADVERIGLPFGRDFQTIRTECAGHPRERDRLLIQTFGHLFKMLLTKVVELELRPEIDRLTAIRDSQPRAT